MQMGGIVYLMQVMQNIECRFNVINKGKKYVRSIA